MSWAEQTNCTTSHIWWASWYSWYFELIHLHELADFMNLWTGRAIHAQTCHYENGPYIPRTQKTWKGSKQQFHYHYTFVTHSSQTYSHDQQVDVHTVHKQQTKQIVMKRCINMHLRSHMWRLNVHNFHTGNVECNVAAKNDMTNSWTFYQQTIYTSWAKETKNCTQCGQLRLMTIHAMMKYC